MAQKLDNHFASPWLRPQAPRRYQRKTPVNREFTQGLKPGQMVVVIPTGRVGMLAELRQDDPSVVQFGADGPFENWWWWKLERATRAQVVAAGLDEVGADREGERP